MLSSSDMMRLDTIFDGVFEKREQRGYLPDRDEDKIAEILFKADESARVQRELLLDSGYGFTSDVKFQERARDIDAEDAAEYNSLSRWKNREIDS